MKYLLLALCAFVFTSCTAVTVRRPDSSHKIKHVLIRDNPKVIVQGFADVVRDGFSRHGISSARIPEFAPVKPTDYVCTYTALRSWDFAPYLSHAEVRIERAGVQVAYAEYHLRGKGGYSMLKWQGVKTKMNPVMDQLLGPVAPR